MSGLEIDLEQALYCARVVVAMFQPRTPPARLLDHLGHLEELSRGSVCGTQSGSVRAESEYELIDADDAASILGCTPRYARRIHADLDGRQIAGRWVFDRKAVEDYARDRIDSRAG